MQVRNVYMTLALFIFIGALSMAVPLSAQATQEAPPASANQSADNKQDQSTPTTQPAAQNPSNTSQAPSASPTSKKPSQKPARSTTSRHKKKVSPNCQSTESSQSASGSGSQNSPADAGTKSATATASGNCPPSKVVVQQGGTSEPSIQLAGPPAQAAVQRDNANQLLGTTEANLKKIAGQQLSSNQQEMVDQIRQYMEQSKAAEGDGDLERARTLAWKAQVLSEELVKPK